MHKASLEIDKNITATKDLLKLEKTVASKIVLESEELALKKELLNDQLKSKERLKHHSKMDTGPRPPILVHRMDTGLRPPLLVHIMDTGSRPPILAPGPPAEVQATPDALFEVGPCTQ
eukprot:gene10728-17803_t